jgi:CcdB protein
MAQQFDVFRTDGGALVVVIQSDLLDAMRTRVVVPLLPAGTAEDRFAASTPSSASARRPWS